MVYLVESSCTYIQTVAALSQHIMFLEKVTQKLPSLALMSVCDEAECNSTPNSHNVHYTAIHASNIYFLSQFLELQD